MPRVEAEKTNVQKAREYAKANGLSYDAAYWLMEAAIRADGRQPRLARDGVGIPAATDLSASDAAALSAAKAAIGL